MPRARTPVIAIDLVRFACAVSVMSYHFCTTAWLEPSLEARVLLADVARPFPALVAAARFNWIGVQIFFVISGAVIALSAMQSGSMAFLRKRLLRLAPAVWLCSTVTLIGLTLVGMGGYDLLLRWARSLILWPLGRQIDPSYWTLGIELCFYLVVAMFVRGRSAQGTGHVADALLAWSAAFWALWFAAEALCRSIGLIPESNLMLIPYGCFFALGIYLADMSGTWSSRRVAKAGFALFLCCAQVAWKAQERELTFALPATPQIPIAIFLGSVLVLAGARRLQPMLARIVSADQARRLGLATYPLYLLHSVIGTITISLLARPYVPTEVAIMAAAMCIVAIAFFVAAVPEPWVRRALDLSLQRLAAARRSRTFSVSSRGIGAKDSG